MIIWSCCVPKLLKSMTHDNIVLLKSLILMTWMCIYIHQICMFFSQHWNLQRSLTQIVSTNLQRSLTQIVSTYVETIWVKLLCKLQCWWWEKNIPLADLGGAPGMCPPKDPNSFVLTYKIFNLPLHTYLMYQKKKR